MGLRSFLRCVAAKVFGVSRRDWRTTPGRLFRRGLRRAADVAQHWQVAEKVREARGLARKRIEGLAREPFERAILAAAQEEQLRTQIELERRTADTQVEHARLRNELVRSEIARNDAERRRLEADALARMIETLTAAGLAIAIKKPFTIDVVPHGGVIRIEDLRAQLDGSVEAGPVRDG